MVIDDWISVDDELPSIGQSVLVFRPLAEKTHDRKIRVVEYSGRNTKSPQGIVHGFNCWCHPTYWTPLPDPPK